MSIQSKWVCNSLNLLLDFMKCMTNETGSFYSMVLSKTTPRGNGHHNVRLCTMEEVFVGGMLNVHIDFACIEVVYVG